MLYSAIGLPSNRISVTPGTKSGAGIAVLKLAGGGCSPPGWNGTISPRFGSFGRRVDDLRSAGLLSILSASPVAEDSTVAILTVDAIKTNDAPRIHVAERELPDAVTDRRLVKVKARFRWGNSRLQDKAPPSKSHPRNNHQTLSKANQKTLTTKRARPTSPADYDSSQQGSNPARCVPTVHKTEPPRLWYGNDGDLSKS
jgi:hypothetical protein